MKITKIANKIMGYCVKRFYKTKSDLFTADEIVSEFPDIDPEEIYFAIRMLSEEKLLNVQYADNNPNKFQLLMPAVLSSDENTLLKKGYDFIKAVRELF